MRLTLNMMIVCCLWTAPLGAAEYELHLVQADTDNHCAQGSAYRPTFGHVKIQEQQAGQVGVHYCLSIEQFAAIKQELGEPNPAQVEEAP